MRTVDLRFGSPRKPGQAASRLKASHMPRIVQRFGPQILLAVWDFRVCLALQVLDQRPAQIDVQKLAAITNGQNRLSFGKSVFKDGAVGLLALLIGGTGLPRIALPILVWVHVRWTAR